MSEQADMLVGLTLLLLFVAIVLTVFARAFRNAPVSIVQPAKPQEIMSNGVEHDAHVQTHIAFLMSEWSARTSEPRYEPESSEPSKVRGLSDAQRVMLDSLIAGKLRIEWTDTGRQLNQEYLGKLMCTSKETVGLEIKVARERWLDKVRAEQDAPVVHAT